MKERFFDYWTNCQFVLRRGKEGSFEEKEMLEWIQFPDQRFIKREICLHTNSKMVFVVSVISHIYQKKEFLTIIFYSSRLAHCEVRGFSKQAYT